MSQDLNISVHFRRFFPDNKKDIMHRKIGQDSCKPLKMWQLSKSRGTTGSKLSILRKRSCKEIQECHSQMCYIVTALQGMASLGTQCKAKYNNLILTNYLIKYANL